MTETERTTGGNGAIQVGGSKSLDVCEETSDGEALGS